MTKIWRRLHFFSTVVAGLFILLASITGSILAVEPWFHSQNAVSGTYSSDLTYAAFQQKIQEEFIELFSLEQDAYGNLKVEGVGLEKEGTLYVNAQTGKIVASPSALSPIFDLCRDFHRSLFLKTPGRILMGLASLALVFLTISGIGLHLKRAGGNQSYFCLHQSTRNQTRRPCPLESVILGTHSSHRYFGRLSFHCSICPIPRKAHRIS